LHRAAQGPLTSWSGRRGTATSTLASRRAPSWSEVPDPLAVGYDVPCASCGRFAPVESALLDDQGYRCVGCDLDLEMTTRVVHRSDDALLLATVVVFPSLFLAVPTAAGLSSPATGLFTLVLALTAAGVGAMLISAWHADRALPLKNSRRAPLVVGVGALVSGATGIAAWCSWAVAHMVLPG
jgi:hypothetical protein